ncbi:MAG TPA: lactate racemase domain-containing protein, partial [Isosphaeraceae bacterium]|nr:lactate racemase domain-containing protein [Isosphaeraceae bacterium]
MRISVDFGQDQLDIEYPDENVLGVWSGPTGLPDSALKPLVLETLDHPLGYPALRQAVVPGDRVVLPIDPATPALGPMLHAICEILQTASVERDNITILSIGPRPDSLNGSIPTGLSWHVHDPDDESSRAYLATTPEGRRIYLNREVVDADFVLPIGRIGHDPAMGLRGPWSVVFPGLSDT